MRLAVNIVATLLFSTVCYAQTYDLVIKGGTVVDPSQSLAAIRDVGIKNGLVTAIETSIDPELAGQVYDATGKTVVPGLVNLHAHFTSSAWPSGTLGVNVDQIAAARGYTTMVSAGDAGWPNAVAFRTSQSAWTTRTYAFLNIGWRGMANGWEYDALPPNIAACSPSNAHRPDIEVCETAAVLMANWEFYIGLKVRLSAFLVGVLDTAPLQKALDAAALATSINGKQYRIMVHVGGLYSTSTIDTIVSMLRSGDIITHTYSEWANQNGVPTGFAQNASCANHSAAAAVSKGIIIDLGGSSAPSFSGSANAFGPLSYIICGKIGISPDSLSADEFGTGMPGLYSMADWASILFGLNTGNNISPTPPAAFTGPIQTALTLDDVVYKMTRGPALALGDRVPALLGTLQIGAPGDAAILNVQSGSFAYTLNPWTITSPTKIEVVKTIKGGTLM